MCPSGCCSAPYATARTVLTRPRVPSAPTGRPGACGRSLPTGWGPIARRGRRRRPEASDCPGRVARGGGRLCNRPPPLSIAETIYCGHRTQNRKLVAAGVLTSVLSESRPGFPRVKNFLFLLCSLFVRNVLPWLI